MAKSVTGKYVESMSEEEFQQTIKTIHERSASSNDKDGFQMTREEYDGILKSAKDPEFHKMFAEYVDEISDPKHREEQNEYIKQMEAGGHLPPNKRLLYPKSGFVIKTHKASGEKLFVNMVQSDQVEEGKSNRENGGTHFELPHILGPVRLERDKKDSTVSTYDCCFHPTTIERAKISKPFRDMISTITFEAIEKNSSSDNKLLRTYHVLRGVEYKSGSPQPLFITKDPTDDQNEQQQSNLPTPPIKDSVSEEFSKENENDDDDDDDDELEDVATSSGGVCGESTNSIVSNKKKKRRAGKKKKSKSVEEETATSPIITTKPTTKKNIDGFAAALQGKLVTSPSPTAADEAKPVKTRLSRRALIEAPRGGSLPIYTITERENFDMAGQAVQQATKTPVRRRPSILSIAIELPECFEAAGIASDFNTENTCLQLTVKNKEMQVIYSLDAPMPYPIISDRAKAVFHIKTHILKIDVPVVQEMSPVELTESKENEMISEIAQTNPPESVEEKDEEVPPLESKKNKIQGTQIAHSRWLEPQLASEPRKPFARDEPLLVAEDEEKKIATDIFEDKPGSGGVDENVVLPSTCDFMAKDRFKGALDGFVFKLGEHGLGYYRDQAPCRVEWRQQTETLTIIVHVPAATDIQFEHTSPTCVQVRVKHDKGQTVFQVTTLAALDPELSRFDLTDDNCVIIFTKCKPGLWPANTPKKKSVSFDQNAVDISLNDVSQPHIQQQNNIPEVSISAIDNDRQHPFKKNGHVNDDEPDLAPISFKNTLLFEID